MTIFRRWTAVEFDSLRFGGILNFIMRFERVIAATTLTGTLLAGCTSPEPLPPTPSPTSSATESDDTFLYDSTPEENISATDCYRNTHSWAVHIDGTPEDADPDDHTIGIAERSSGDDPVLVTGAKIRSLGNLAYRVTTAADLPGTSTTVDLNEKTYSRVLRGGEGYDANFSLRLGSDGDVYATINCLPNFGFHGDSTPVPLLPPDMPTPDVAGPSRDNEVNA